MRLSTSNNNNESKPDNYQINAKICRLVEHYPCMYDRSHPHYLKKDVVDKAWIKISKEMNDSIPSCKERWRNIRTSFARSINVNKIPSSANRTKPYYLHEELQFLARHITPGIPVSRRPNYYTSPDEKSEMIEVPIGEETFDGFAAMAAQNAEEEDREEQEEREQKRQLLELRQQQQQQQQQQERADDEDDASKQQQLERRPPSSNTDAESVTKSSSSGHADSNRHADGSPYQAPPPDETTTATAINAVMNNDDSSAERRMPVQSSPLPLVQHTIQHQLQQQLQQQPMQTLPQFVPQSLPIPIPQQQQQLPTTIAFAHLQHQTNGFQQQQHTNIQQQQPFSTPLTLPPPPPQPTLPAAAPTATPMEVERVVAAAAAEVPVLPLYPFKKRLRTAESLMMYAAEAVEQERDVKPQPSELCTPDPPDFDATFLQGLLPEMKAMDFRQKIIFKKRIYEVIGEIFEGTQAANNSASASSTRRTSQSFNNNGATTPLNGHMNGASSGVYATNGKSHAGTPTPTARPTPTATPTPTPQPAGAASPHAIDFNDAAAASGATANSTPVTATVNAADLALIRRLSTLLQSPAVVSSTSAVTTALPKNAATAITSVAVRRHSSSSNSNNSTPTTAVTTPSASAASTTSSSAPPSAVASVHRGALTRSSANLLRNIMANSSTPTSSTNAAGATASQAVKQETMDE